MSDTGACRICLEETGVLIQPCGCKGSTANVHIECLKKWVNESGSEECEICKTPYAKQEVVACNMDSYCHALFRPRSESNVEQGLIRVSALHAIVAIIGLAYANIDDWMLIASIQTLTYTLGLILVQTYHYDKPFFVLNVLLCWSVAYLGAAIVVSTIRTMDNEEMCKYNCMRLAQLECTDKCIVFDYYDRKDIIASNVLWLYFFKTIILFGLKCVALCFTQHRRVVYHNRSLSVYTSSSSSSSSSDGNGEELAPLLEESV